MPPKVEKEQKDACGGVTPCPLSAKLIITLRTAFYNPGEGECWSPGTAIVGATIKMGGATAKTVKKTVKTGLHLTVPVLPGLKGAGERNVGRAELPVGDFPDGNYEMEIVPPAGQDADHAADSKTTRPASGYRWRPIKIKLALTGRMISGIPVIVDPDAVLVAAGLAPQLCYAYLWNSTTEIAIDWKPEWVQNVFSHYGRAKKPTLIVLHKTDGSVMSGAVNTAQDAGSTGHGWHYLLDHDGHVEKYVEDDKGTANVAPGRWRGELGANSYLVGIELLHKLEVFSAGQYTSLIRLLREIMPSMGIAPHRIVGHSDVDVADADKITVGANRHDDPGPNFDWTKLEDAGLGIIPDPTTPHNEGWAAYFNDHPEALGTSNKIDPNVKKAAILGLQEDLIQIGYSIRGATGTWDSTTAAAIRAFKRHFLTGRRGPFPGEKAGDLSVVNASDAWLIQAAAAAVARAETAAAMEKLKAPVVGAAKSAAGALGAIGSFVSGPASAPAPAPAAAPAPAPAPAPASPPGSKPVP